MKTTGEANTRTQTWHDYDTMIHLSKEEAKELIRETIRARYGGGGETPISTEHAIRWMDEETENAYQKMEDKSKFTLGITVRLQVEKPDNFRIDSYEHWFKVLIE